MSQSGKSKNKIAIIGMGGRFPGADDVRTFWTKLCNGEECITHFSDEELLENGVDRALLSHPRFVRSRPIVANVDQFDAKFFRYSNREAEMIDPQQRVFLECAWEAMEDAGYAPGTDGWVGVFAGTTMSTYLFSNLNFGKSPLRTQDVIPIQISNDKDYLATRVSYKLDLRGPSVTVQSACSTSLVAVQQACQSLLTHESDMALAGGVAITIPQKYGYVYAEGDIYSPDGHCRPFSADAAGTVFGDAAGVVLLKRYADALRDGDHIYAVIASAAINNDGAAKANYSAPSAAGQAEVISLAQLLAGVQPEQIDYVETHGTGTAVGDPIEFAALKTVFEKKTTKRQFCALGSVKSNIGHTNAAAGVVSLIKTALILQHKVIPPSINFSSPNPSIDFKRSPFYWNTRLTELPEKEAPHVAAVSSFGIGGTNAHLILEEHRDTATDPPRSGGALGRGARGAQSHESGSPASQRAELVPLSARSTESLAAMRSRLADYLEENPGTHLGNLAYTLRVGRAPFEQRDYVVAESPGELREKLRAPKSFASPVSAESPRVVFLFPGQGAQYPGMAADLYARENVFRECVDECSGPMDRLLGERLLDVLFAPGCDLELAAAKLEQTRLAQPALFVVEYALAKLLASWNIRPHILIGHSIGEITAACVAGAIELKDALCLVAERGRLMQAMPEGRMLAVPLAAAKLLEELPGDLSLAAVNAPELCVVSGARERIEDFQQRLVQRGIEGRLLRTSHGFHSHMMEPAAEAFRTILAGIAFRKPEIPFVSNVTGQRITDAELKDSSYWSRHLRERVRFSEGIQAMADVSNPFFIEVGPGETLCKLAGLHYAGARPPMHGTIPPPMRKTPAGRTLLECVGSLWASGYPVHLRALSKDRSARRLSLPTYPFHRKRLWRTPEVGAGQAPEQPAPQSIYYCSQWVCRSDSVAVPRGGSERHQILLFGREETLAKDIGAILRGQGHSVVLVKTGGGFQRCSRDEYIVRPSEGEDYRELVACLRRDDIAPRKLVHLWTLLDPSAKNGSATDADLFSRGYFSLLEYLRQHTEHRKSPLDIAVVTSGVVSIAGEVRPVPENATLLGPVRVVPQESDHVTCRLIDIVPESRGAQGPRMAERIADEVLRPTADAVIAVRPTGTWVQSVDSLGEAPARTGKPLLREGGTYLVTGGTGGIGWALAKHLAAKHDANLILMSRGGFPPRDEWESLKSSKWIQPSVAERIREIRTLEKEHKKMVLLTGDVADSPSVRAAIDAAHSEFGALHGVFHAAGVFDQSVFTTQSQEAVRETWAPKVVGCDNLVRCLNGLALDFLFLFSSTSAAVGGPGLSAYAAANAYLQAAAQRFTMETGIAAYAVMWDLWAEVGMATSFDLARKEGLRTAVGMQAIEDILNARDPRPMVVSSRNFYDVAHALRTKRVPTKEPALPSQDQMRQVPAADAPKNGVEREIADIWSALLGAEAVSRNDNFFDLGGHSLIAIQALARLKESFCVDISMTEFFGTGTLGQLADLVAERIAAALDEEDCRQLVSNEKCAEEAAS